MRFESLVEEVKLLPFEMKQELKSLIEKYLIEEKRKDIQRNYKKSRKEYNADKIEFSGNIGELKSLL